VEQDGQRGVQAGVRSLNWTTIALIGGLVLLVLVIAYFVTRGNADQDKLTNVNLAASSAPSREKLCASQATYDLIKRDLFRRAAQLRGSDQAAYDQISSAAVVRMENPVMESADSTTGAAHCSGSLSLDLPPGIAAAGARRTLTADVDYSVQQAADESGPVVFLSNADAIIRPLATLARVAHPLLSRLRRPRKMASARRLIAAIERSPHLLRSPAAQAFARTRRRGVRSRYAAMRDWPRWTQR
jgi:hypothetical protein